MIRNVTIRSFRTGRYLTATGGQFGPNSYNVSMQTEFNSDKNVWTVPTYISRDPSYIQIKSTLNTQNSPAYLGFESNTSVLNENKVHYTAAYTEYYQEIILYKFTKFESILEINLIEFTSDRIYSLYAPENSVQDSFFKEKTKPGEIMSAEDLFIFADYNG
ncbi:hypothetical protein [Brucella sp. 22210]|uniref:hypothetical protein n=1 Tax=Brucella sp. 22210 TaxID=3453892 RepID=UPI003F83325B